MYSAFAAFLSQVRPGGTIVACAEDVRLSELVARVDGRQVIKYGIGPTGAAPTVAWQWWAADVRPEGGRMRCTISHRVEDGGPVQTADVTLAVHGRHNVLNATAALAACSIVGVPLAPAAAALADFHGARRRFQLSGEAGGVRVYEDYAHHPTEVRVMLDAARPLVPPGGRLWAVFQPHLRVRTERLFDEFARSFAAADRVVLTDVYSPSGREPAGAYRGSRELVQAMGHPGATHVGEPAAARSLLAAELRPGDAVLVMGAGPIVDLAAQLVQDLTRRLPQDQRANG
jgi:UDP-N-acetylmuramate--alanine ligase